jgi:hypothetical protein
MPKRKSSSVYRHDGKHYLVELDLRDARQLFNSLDPAPFREKDLDSAAEEYIVGAVRELGLRHASRIVIHIPADGFKDESAQSIAGAIKHYFDYRARHAADELKRMLVRGALSLGIALVFLFLCLWTRQFVIDLSEQPAQQIIGEGLLIMGWVAMWRPIEIFLYDWWPLRHRIRIFRRIEAMPIEVKETRDHAPRA